MKKRTLLFNTQGDNVILLRNRSPGHERLMWNDVGPPSWGSSPRTGLHTERGRSRGSMMNGVPGAFFSRGGLGPVGWGGKAVGTRVCPRGTVPFPRLCHHPDQILAGVAVYPHHPHAASPPSRGGKLQAAKKGCAGFEPTALGVQITCWFCTNLFPQAEWEPPDRGGSLFELTVVKGEERAAPQAQSFL